MLKNIGRTTPIILFAIIIIIIIINSQIMSLKYVERVKTVVLYLGQDLGFKRPLDFKGPLGFKGTLS